ncbi:MAG: hypothetical protein H8E12_14435 [Rhodobacteraceae bacterium]|nr:hypothetical protein [Paracoccaceae bacterium]
MRETPEKPFEEDSTGPLDGAISKAIEGLTEIILHFVQLIRKKTDNNTK